MTVRELKGACPEGGQNLRALQATVAEILATVQRDGDKALLAYAKKFDGYEGQIRLGAKEIEEAKRAFPQTSSRG